MIKPPQLQAPKYLFWLKYYGLNEQHVPQKVIMGFYSVVVIFLILKTENITTCFEVVPHTS